MLDAVLLTVNVCALGLAVILAAGAFNFQRQRLAVWNDRAPWLGPLLGTMHAALMLAIIGAVYWATYRFLGVPGWMRWIVG